MTPLTAAPDLPQQLTRGAGGWLNSTAALSCHDTASVRSLEARAVAEGLSEWHLMRRAADAAWRVMRSRWHDKSSAAIFCGSGNNGGDGRVLASLAARRGWQVTVVECGSQTGTLLDKESRKLVQEAGIATVSAEQWLADDKATDDAEVLVDALLGTGVRGEVRAETAKLLQRIGESGRPILALDTPSGLNADTGHCLGPVAKAAVTVTFIAPKPGLLTGEGREFSGALYLATLGLPPAWLEQAAPGSGGGRHYPLLLSGPLRQKLAQPLHRRADSHKSQLGHVLIVGGDEGMGGAALMAAEAALRCGSGLVSAAVCASAVPGFLARCPEIMVQAVAGGQDLEPLLPRADAVVLGPGLGQGARAEQFVQRVLAGAAENDYRLVVDAGALRLLTPKHRWREQLPTGAVLTPHSGEAAALLDCTAAEIAADRFSSARSLAEQTGCVAVLKGSGTVVAADTDPIGLCPAGNAGMATAGSGDILAGLIGALMGRGLAAADAAQLAVAAHAEAGDRAALIAGEAGMTATDLIPHLTGLTEGAACV